MKQRIFLSLLILLVILTAPVFAQDETPVPEEPAPTIVPYGTESPGLITVDSSIIVLLSTAFSIIAVTVISGIAVFKSGGTAQEAIRLGAEKGVRSLIGNEGLTNTVESRLLAIPEAQRHWLMELVNLASPITDTSMISRDAARWIQNVLDGNAETGAIPFTASSTSEGFMLKATTETPNKPEEPLAAPEG